MILGRKYRKRRSIRSENFFFFFFFFLENGMILGEKYGKRRSIQSEDLFFLEIIMIFGEKLQSARSKSSFVFKENQFLRILASGP